MKSSKLRFGLFLCVGVLLLVIPPCIFHWEAGPGTKIVALRYLAVSITGLSLIVLALTTEYFARRERFKDTSA